ncbi:DOPA 4,5-dioxygenase family protein [Sphingomonas flavalba]|uniref:DOPA 4,5-dioxygenase family protein n=1 Tax=Sphingomonas flavalba TaxID=2559804 RepID=UPI0039E05F4B
MSHAPYPRDAADDQHWADLLSPQRRRFLLGTGAVAAAGALAAPARAQPQAGAPARHTTGQSPWGYDTYREATPRPVSVRPGEQALPSRPQPYTRIESYHAHVYFDEDSYEKAALLRRWSAERFHVELGNWNLEPRGPHVTPSFYFGFTNDLVPVVIPWLQLNSLGLTILLHPNTDDPRADHLYYALWVNRSQPVNAYAMKPAAAGQPRVEQIHPNTHPSIAVETA